MSAAQRLRASRALGVRGRGRNTLGRRRLALGPLAPLLIRIPPVIPDQVFAHLRDVLGHFSQEVQRIENLEVALGQGVDKGSVPAIGNSSKSAADQMLCEARIIP